MKKVDPSKVPLIPDDPDVLFSPYSFTEDTIAKIKALLPEITDKKIDAMAVFMGEQLHMSQIMDRLPDEPLPNMGRVAKELYDIQAAVETLLGLLGNASGTALNALSSSYFFQKNAPTGITDKRFPGLKDVGVVLDAFKQSMHSSCEIRSLVEYRQKVLSCKGKHEKPGAPPGGADDEPYILLDGLNKIFYPGGGVLGQTAGVKLGEILGLSSIITKNRVVDWLKWQRERSKN